MQTRTHSFIEALANVVVGSSINMLANFLVFPLFGWSISVTQNLALVVIYTLISIARSYTLRRWFNRKPKHIVGEAL